jgi:hypothetical protein
MLLFYNLTSGAAAIGYMDGAGNYFNLNNLTVVPVNSDLADTVGVEHFPSILSYSRVIGIACCNAVAFPNSSGIAA